MNPTNHEPESSHALAQGFRDVDGAASPTPFAAYLDAVAIQLKEHKRASYNMLELRPGDRVLEVGCGTGDDARALAVDVVPGGNVVGIDISARLIEHARARSRTTEEPVDFIVADAQATGLATDSFDAARVERCLQHVERPQAVIGEMRRVVRPGGWVVAGEPDWDTLAIDATDHTLTRSITQTLSDRHVMHGTIGRHLAALMVTAGLQDLTIRPITLLTRSFAVASDVFLLRSATEDPRVRSANKPERLRAWLSDLQQREAQGRFFAALGGFLVRARVPR
jgi:SAM-dependent methyltransferase